MDLLGLPLGPVTLVVGTDDDAMRRAVREALGRGHRVLEGSRGVSDVVLSSCLGTRDKLGLLDLGDSVHPAQHKALVERLRACGVPVVATTHNPYVVDYFTPEEVIVLTPAGARRLSDYPDAKMQDAYTTGEFLTASGWWWS